MSKVLIVADNLEEIRALNVAGEVISFAEYLEEHPKKGEKSIRLINLCNTERYLSQGYYCSLLAEARGHRVLPSVNTINDLRSKPLYMSLLEDLLQTRDEKGQTEQPGEKRTVFIHFGQAADPAYNKLAQKLFDLFPAPILKVSLIWKNGWKIKQVMRTAPAHIPPQEKSRFYEALTGFTARHWKSSTNKKRYRWDMAILVDPEEVMPPSDEEALKRLAKAAGKVKINTDFITARDYSRLVEYDALLIRETTAIDHHTYRFARKAEIEGLVVVDDPASILRCCNKVFLQDAFSYNNVPTLKTRAVFQADAGTLDELESQFGFPVVLKVPESSFSRGVFKVANRTELEEQMGKLLTETSIVLAQEYLFTEYDWRIGIFNHRPLYACRYYMARNHWQIYNHGSARHSSGGFETLPTFEVPRSVLDAALRAARVIGDGLYGVDIKQSGRNAYVIEINDNPSIEHKIEDAYLGDELYMLIMAEFSRRLEQR